jgi:hypothetical protein
VRDAAAGVGGVRDGGAVGELLADEAAGGVVAVRGDGAGGVGIGGEEAEGGLFVFCRSLYKSDAYRAHRVYGSRVRCAGAPPPEQWIPRLLTSGFR